MKTISGVALPTQFDWLEWIADGPPNAPLY